MESWTTYEVYSKLAIKTPGQSFYCDFEQIFHTTFGGSVISILQK